MGKSTTTQNQGRPARIVKKNWRFYRRDHIVSPSMVGLVCSLLKRGYRKWKNAHYRSPGPSLRNAYSIFKGGTQNVTEFIRVPPKRRRRESRRSDDSRIKYTKVIQAGVLAPKRAESSSGKNPDREQGRNPVRTTNASEIFARITPIWRHQLRAAI